MPPDNKNSYPFHVRRFNPVKCDRGLNFYVFEKEVYPFWFHAFVVYMYVLMFYLFRTLADSVTTLQKQQKAEREAQARNRVSAHVTSDILREVLDEETLRSAQDEFRYKL